MEYFNILNLHKEPFSNSPEPELFFLSGQHQRCLQRMELAIRLRRGLNVVIGEIGTGKTTLCRQLILRLAPSEDDNMIQTHLILDPSFSSPLEFLLAVSKVFGLTEASGEQSEWQLKERINNYLFTRGVEAGRIVVLIVDEGQKLPAFCVEILREFLNYETTNSKLLQIIIFAQEEFRQSLRMHANFADRVNELYHLGPLSFKETRKMIRFRLARACRDGAPPPLFTFSGFLAIHRATGGYPRKIITLCHQVILALIIKNQTKVD
jgi:general secretion pathway protein A